MRRTELPIQGVPADLGQAPCWLLCSLWLKQNPLLLKVSNEFKDFCNPMQATQNVSVSHPAEGHWVVI